ncbi:hypothetical protein OIU77_011224 [Salix suchowensis]|uniref:DUF3741 domain-containing protein n=1 Tax=Salix suchowensis TaxID=1278906 RepID=A0ABQ9AB08_9ROSI|nr:hypothetical protein OIU77_011224 [Salix suchowensis]
MALVRHKFMEAKCLSVDEKGCQSREFQDALEVLSSNKDLFLKFLQESNSFFSPHLHDLQSMSPSPKTKCIIVLRPSKVDVNETFAGSRKKSDKLTKKQSHTGQAIIWEKSNLGYSSAYSNQMIDEYDVERTKIVVLKPSHRKIHDIKALVSSPSPPPPPKMLCCELFYDEPEDFEGQESREVAKEITRNIHPIATSNHPTYSSSHLIAA